MKNIVKLITVIYFIIFCSNAFVQDSEYSFRYGSRRNKINAINTFMRQKTNHELNLLIESLKNKREDIFIRKYVIHALRVFPQKKVKEVLIWAMECSNTQLRREAALVISKYKLNEIMFPLLNLLNDTDYRVRKNALYTISKIGNNKVLAFIKRCLYDNHPEVRRQALTTIMIIRKRR